MKNSRTTLILGAATNYRPEQIADFVYSIKLCESASTVALLVEKGNHDLANFLRNAGITPIPIELQTKWLPRLLAERRNGDGRIKLLRKLIAFPTKRKIRPRSFWRHCMAECSAGFHHVSNSRYWYFLKHLRKHGMGFSHVLLTDVRDVRFQDDPFKHLPDECLWLFSEPGSMKLADEPSNRAWIQNAYGMEELERIGTKPILCSGTTLGSTEQIVEYLEKIVDEIIRLTPIIAGKLGYDQGIHNWLYWNGHLRSSEVKSNFFGPIATLQLESSDNFRFDNLDRLLNSDDSVIALLHQYDRHARLVKSNLNSAN